MGSGSHRVAVAGAVDDFGDNAGVASRGPFLVDGLCHEGRPRLLWAWSQKLGRRSTTVRAPRWKTEQWAIVRQPPKDGGQIGGWGAHE